MSHDTTEEQDEQSQTEVIDNSKPEEDEIQDVSDTPVIPEGVQLL